MTKRMLIDAVHPEETRVVIADDSRIDEYDFVTTAKAQIKGNIYLAKITRVEPSLQAAFVEYGGNKQGFLPFAEIHPDYYQIPVSDRERLLAEVAAMDDEEERPRRRERPSRGRRGERSENQDASAPMDSDMEPGSYLPENPDGENERDQLDAQETDEAEGTFYQPAESSDYSISSEPLADDHMPHGSDEDAIPFYSNEVTEPLDQPAGEVIAPVSGERVEVAASEEVETIGDEDAEEDDRPRRHFSRRYKIQEVIKRGQVMLVQVIKEERGNKGASVTTYMSLAGRYCVLMPNSPKGGGISRKISSGEDRKRLKQISAELKTQDGMSAIIRTAGIDRTRVEIKRDYDYLVKLWNTIRETTLASTAPAMVYEEGDVVKRAIRDLYSSNIEEILVEGEASYRTAKDFMKMIMPSHAARVKSYKDNIPLFYRYDIEDQLHQMNDPVVRLRSGGYIVINPTEALISIDVNSGRFTGERNIEETATKTNIEAAQEVARQLRLRDLAGLIVIDFIDMSDFRHKRTIERTLKDALKSDRAKIQIGRISPFGLLEMSRQRLRPSISETSSMTCPHCQGKGVIRAHPSIGIQIVRALEREVSQGDTQELRVMTGNQVAIYLLNHQRDTISSLEKQHNIRITIQIDESQMATGFKIEKVKMNGQTITIKDEIGSGAGNRPRRRRRGGRDRDSNGRDEHNSFDSTPDRAEAGDAEAALNDAAERDDEGNEIAADGEQRSERGPRGERSDRPRRGRRGGRNRRRGGRDREPHENFAQGEPNGESREFAEGERPEQDSQPAEFVDGGDNAAAADDGRPRTDRGPRERGGRNRSRGRRGGRNRGPRENAPATEGEPGNSDWVPQQPYRPAAESFHSSAMSHTAPTSYSYDSDPLARPRSSTPVSSSSEHNDSSGDSDENREKKRGWWRRMVD